MPEMEEIIDANDANDALTGLLEIKVDVVRARDVVHIRAVSRLHRMSQH